ncbi:MULTISPECIES: hypothetical protein [unclassified Pseudomonas]|uniref:hypothetical protein n=1 Tax=unclassified Pseudomonas TaxID=196821 RepID=UPI002AC8E866|nr:MULTISPECIES: hypothetical protein [unclassified Pseudomonas]MEB0046403.1 hypothetical protein [Pseudomonas sp. Dout3]MEB0097672.1 hypothetical protein [Pseudomonas sp. DC1.2]WPX57739.1 hypothetical protein RHM68_19280 [Pseudomonas sp. DC1.2]
MTIKKEEFGSSNVHGLDDASSKGDVSEEQWQAWSAGRHVKTETFKLKFGTDKFTGELTIAYFWNELGTSFYGRSLQYKITKGAGQSGGNKANVYFFFESADSWGSDSPDAMWQDGEWHNYSRIGSVPVKADKKVRLYIRFIFDSPGSDPKVEENYWLTFSNEK